MVQYFNLLFRAWKCLLVDNPEEIRYLLHTIHQGATAIDVGAHKGGYTFWMRRAVGAKGHIIAFEPQRKGASLLKALFRNTQVQVEHLALSNSTGQQELYIQPQAYEVSFEASLENKYGNSITERIDTTTLDHYCKKHGLTPSFIKIDVEGHELKVLEGALAVLRYARPVLLVECEMRHGGPLAVEQLFQFLGNLQYSGFFYRKGKRTPLELFDAQQDQRTELAGTRRYVNNFFFEPNRLT